MGVHYFPHYYLMYPRAIDTPIWREWRRGHCWFND